MKRVRLEAEECEYIEQDRQIKEQFICGLDDEGMQTKIMSEIKAKIKTDNVTSKQVFMLAKQEEINMIQSRGVGQTNVEAGQTDAKMIKAGTCKYCGSSHPPRRCPAYGMMCGECSWVNNFSAVCRAPRRRLSRREEQSNGQTNQVKSNHVSHNYKSIKACTEAEISTTSFYNSIDIRFKLDMGRNNNYMPFHIYKKLFPKVTNRYIRQPKTCKVKLMHNGKEKMCKFFVAHNGSPVVLGMQILTS